MTGLLSYRSADGLLLSAEETSGPGEDAPCALCLHGLTRNGRDFEALATALSRTHRVIRPDQRGRGRSAYDPNPLNYNIIKQTQDMWRLLDVLDVARCAVVGTSMGGLMGVLMANERPDRIGALVLNDVGPEVDPRGLARIAGYVGVDVSAGDWGEAAARLKIVHAQAFPTYSDEDWLRLARATYRDDDGQLVLDYDPALAVALGQMAKAPLDLWPAFEVLRHTPTLVLRGALSDILSETTLAEMKRRFPAIETAIVPDRGHAPDLGEPESLRAVADFLATIEIAEQMGG